MKEACAPRNQAADSSRQIDTRVSQLACQVNNENCQKVDRVFAILMVLQWVAGIVAALSVSPYTWIGASAQLHVHVSAAVILGGAIATLPIVMAWCLPGAPITRHVIAVGQVFFSTLLIHLTGGRIETHFHVFGSLAFLSLYRDWRVLITASLIVAVDHIVRGIWWPLSVYGVAVASPYRWIEHTGWVIFEDVVLIFACLRSQRETRIICKRQAELEQLNARFEEKVHERTAVLNAILDSVPEGIVAADRDGNPICFNQKAEEILGQQKIDGLAPADWAEAYRLCDPQTGKTMPADQVPLYRAMRGEAVYEDLVLVRKDNEDSLVSASSCPLTPELASGAVAIFRDVTREHKWQYHLRLLRSAVDNANEMMITVSSRGTILDVNEFACRRLQYEHDELIGMHIADIDPSVSRKNWSDHWSQLRTKKSTVFESEYCSKNAEEIPVEISTVLVLHDGKEFACSFIRDISERLRSEANAAALAAEMRQMSRRAGMAEVATDVLHNVGNVLNSINVSANLLIDSLDDSPVQTLCRVSEHISANETQLAEFLESERGKHLPRLLDQLSVALSQQEQMQLKEVQSLLHCADHVKRIIDVQQTYAKTPGREMELVDIGSLIDDALKINDGGLLRHGVNVVQEIESTTQLVTQKHKVLQILVNLISNAKYALSDSECDDKRLTISVTEVEGQVSVVVRDNGVGIPNENLTKIFAHGFTTKKDGHGFGLHSSALAAEDVGGSLSAHSDGPNQGATFQLRLPIEREASCNL